MWDVEAEIVTRDGKRKYTHAIARPQKQADGSVLWTGVILDATRMKRAKRALRAAKEQAEAASAAKSEFLANMSHELRTPLNAVIGFSETMLGEIFGPLGHERYREYMQDIHLSGAHLLDLVNDILDLSKVAAGEAEVRDDIVDLRELTEICAHLVEERVHKADLTIDIDASIGLKVRADETKLRQILLNLLSNAIKFTSGGGRIELSAARSADGWFELRVVDNGIGIDPERIPEMLQPFQQVESAMSRKNGGTGLGLPLVKALAELHDGRFELRSEPDVGTTAIVTLPADRAVGQRAA